MTRCFQQNDTLFSAKRHVVFGMMKYFQFHPLWHLWQQKTKLVRTGARIHARANTFGQYQTFPSLNQTNQSTSPPFRIPLKKKIHRRISQIINNEIINDEKGSFDIWSDLILKRMVWFCTCWLTLRIFEGSTFFKVLTMLWWYGNYK